jgi:putative membrane protein
MMNMDMGGFGWLGMGLMWLWALVPVGLVVGVGWLIARAAGGRGGQFRGDDAAAILRRRLAAGEIDVEEYEKARAALGPSGGGREGGSSD